MSRLTIYADDAPDRPLSSTTDAGHIAAGLAEIGVLFENWCSNSALPADADDAAILAAYSPVVARLNDTGDYDTVDVMRLTADNPAAPELRAKFLSEHTHAEDEIRLFVAGSAQFYLHRAGRVFITTCVAGDLISVPAGVPHWFDTGPCPSFTAIRWFGSPAGWVAQFTGSGLAEHFPMFAGTAEPDA